MNRYAKSTPKQWNDYAAEYVREHAEELVKTANLYSILMDSATPEERADFLNGLRIAYNARRNQVIEGSALLFTLVDREEFRPEDLTNPEEFLREYYCRLASPHWSGWDYLGSVHEYVPYQMKSTLVQTKELQEALGLYEEPEQEAGEPHD